MTIDYVDRVMFSKCGWPPESRNFQDDRHGSVANTRTRCRSSIRRLLSHTFFRHIRIVFVLLYWTTFHLRGIGGAVFVRRLLLTVD